MMNPQNNDIYYNKTPYYIRYNFTSKIAQNESFVINDIDLNIEKIQVWYGRKWMTKSEIICTNNCIQFKKNIIVINNSPIVNMNFFQSLGNMLSKK